MDCLAVYWLWTECIEWECLMVVVWCLSFNVVTTTCCWLVPLFFFIIFFQSYLLPRYLWIVGGGGGRKVVNRSSSETKSYPFQVSSSIRPRWPNAFFRFLDSKPYVCRFILCPSIFPVTSPKDQKSEAQRGGESESFLTYSVEWCGIAGVDVGGRIHELLVCRDIFHVRGQIGPTTNDHLLSRVIKLTMFLFSAQTSIQMRVRQVVGV